MFPFTPRPPCTDMTVLLHANISATIYKSFVQIPISKEIQADVFGDLAFQEINL